MKLIRHHFDTIHSTNTWAKEHVQMLSLEDLTLITASEQTQGRGRFKRVWVSPLGGNIYATFCFFVETDWQNLGYIPQILAVSTAKTLAALGAKPSLKWPNDILLSQKKVGGILCETASHVDRRCVICGIGLNINMNAEQLSQIDRPATSLFIEMGLTFDSEAVLMTLVQHFQEDLNQFLNRGFALFFKEIEKYSSLIPGQKVRFHDNQRIVEGIFISLNPEGSITLLLTDGSLKTYYAGEFI